MYTRVVVVRRAHMISVTTIIAFVVLLIIIITWYRQEGWSPGQPYSGPASTSTSAPAAPPPPSSTPSAPSVPYNAGQGAGHQGRNTSIGAYGGWGGGWGGGAYRRRYAYAQPYFAPIYYSQPQVYVAPNPYAPWLVRPWWQRWWPWGTPDLPDCEDVNYAQPCYDGRA